MWGGVAFLITGCVLSAMCGLYFYSSSVGENFLKSRIFWEVVLNFQVVSLALIWFAYDDRIENAKGRWRARMTVNLIFAVTVNLAPLGFFFYTAGYAWAGAFPDEAEVAYIVRGIVLGWLVFEIVVQSSFRLVTGQLLLRSGGVPKWSMRRFFANMWPVVLMVIVVVGAEVTGERWFFIVAPIFGYMKGGLDFFRLAFREPKQETTA